MLVLAMTKMIEEHRQCNGGRNDDDEANSRGYSNSNMMVKIAE